MATSEEAVRGDLDVDTFCNKFATVKTIAEVETLDLKFNSPCSLFHKEEFDEFMARVAVDLAAHDYALQPMMYMVVGPIAQHYVDVAKFLHAGVQNSRLEDEKRFQPTWIGSFNRNVMQRYVVSAVRDAAKTAVHDDA